MNHQGQQHNAGHVTLEPGTLIKDRYYIERCIGSGASSTVYRALDIQLASLPVALKVFNQSFMNLPHFSQMYSRELQSSFAVDDENVVRLYDMIRTQSLIALVTEFIDGITLDEYARSNGQALTDQAVRKITIGILRGLSAIHNKGLIHRDVKPQNVLISHDGSIKINDFGVAKPDENEKSWQNNQTGQTPTQVTGTPYYTDPVYLQGGTYDNRSDLHSVGIIAFELLTGRELFDTASPASFLISKVESPVPPVLYCAPACNPALANVIDILLARNPEDRFQTAREALNALEKVPLSSVELHAASEKYSDELPGHITKNFENSAKRKRGSSRSILANGILFYLITAVIVYYLIYHTGFWYWLMRLVP